MSQIHTIGVVDDDEEVRDSIAAVFRSEGMSVCAFPNAESLLTSPLIDTLDCLVTDLHMPGIDGFGLRRELIDQGKQLPVVMMTAFATPEARDIADSLGIEEFLEKPADPDVLLKVVRSLLAN
ncbi:response regulator transcription factor [Dyella humicola]|uniref:response regulator transcription factor n=1 Tax=Dyella humicola TaxID=2992126 RepID=UPI00225152D3|nr:response regulator [Dyella humicola]